MRGRPIELPGAWGEAARAAGSSANLARVLRVSTRTLERWACGGCPYRRMGEVEAAFADRGWTLPTFEEAKDVGETASQSVV